MDWTPHETIIGVAALTLVVFVLLARAALKGTKRPTPEKLAVEEEMDRLAYERMIKCVCGEVATEPAPILKRSRGAWDWLRSIFAAAPRYKRVVDPMQAPVFCRSHSHVADALMDQFIFGIRGKYSELNARIAGEAAGFEQEALLKQVGDSLTDNQKRAARKAGNPSTVRLLAQKTGTDDVSDT